MYDLNPATYYTHQLKGNLNYPIYQSGRGLGSRLFNIIKSVGAPLLKEIILPTVKAEAGQVIQDITSGVGVKNALKRGAKCAGKLILKRGTQRLMKGKGRKRKWDPSTTLSLMLKSINSAKRRCVWSVTSNLTRVTMSSTLKYISCPVSQLDLLEPIGVQTQVESFKDVEYLPTSAIQDGVPITFEIGKDERFTDLSELVIKTVVEIQGENGTALTGKQFTNAESAGTLEKVGVINNLGHSLWEQIVLTINDTKVTESSNNYAYKAMLETLLSYDDADQKSVLCLSCFKKDHGNITAEFPTAIHANKGLVQRSKYFEGGKK